jgi:hypothetical protein
MNSKVYRNFSTYQVTIHFHIGENKVNLINEKFGLDLEDNFDGIAQKINNYDYLIYINSETLNIAILGHELSHLSDLIVSTFELEISLNGNTEVRARIIEQLTSKILKDFRQFVKL